ncbi:MAG TPA: hypothetical protein PLS03_08630, partial [Terrimicrobiaceae bacterium]|nr:hypothetical protein [Terrimicrobiaceae bacterium]
NEEEARRKDLDPDAYAAKQADLWRKGLASWGEGPERIRALRDKVDMAIYTPGSSSGLQVNVLASFHAPEAADEEMLADRVQTTVASLLGLLKIDPDPVKSRESILLSAILHHEWSLGHDLDLPGVIERIQKPPFQKIGVLDLETFFSAKDRFSLVVALNNLLAAPGFAAWQKGEPLDAGAFLHTAEGRPRLSIFSLAHLSDEERMFFVALLLNEVLSWTRAQSGTTSLRAVLYMDEIFGYLPPTANPASKLPLLTLLKQARAYGVGVVLATQNPVDLDYKALSNAGTWFIGRLQTERDQARVLDGLQGTSAGGNFDRAAMASVLSGLGNRVFLMNNVHDDGPVVFETRWVMSYLRGPLTRDQIRTLMDPRKAAEVPVREPVSGSRPAATRPVLPPQIRQVFLPASSPGPVLYRPCLLGAAAVQFKDAKLGVDFQEDIAVIAAIPDGIGGVDWAGAESWDGTADELREQPEPGAGFSDDTPALQERTFASWEKEFPKAIAASRTLTLWRCAELKAISKPGETEAEFRSRIALMVREKRDADVDALRRKYAPRLAALQARRTRAEAAVQRQRDQASNARMQTLISVGSTVLGALFGRKAISSSTLNKAATAARGVGRSMKEGSDVGIAEESVESINRQLEAMEAEFGAESAAILATEPGIEAVKIKPQRNVTARFFAVAWRP